MMSPRNETSSVRAPAAADEATRSINARLADAAARGETLEVILVLRGKVRIARGSDRWRIREAGGRVLTFRATAVVAATTVTRRETRARGAGRARV